MEIIYVHHANRKSSKNQMLDDLSSLGKKDAALLGKLFKIAPIKEKLKAIYSAPSNRCQLTAKMINKYLNAPIILDERLDEFESHKKEKYKEFLQRTANCLDDIVEKYDDNDLVICVVSGVNVSAFICRCFGIKITNNIPKIGIPCCSPLIFNIKKETK